MTDADLDELLGVPPSEFVAARGELVRRLKTDGERERAAEVARIRRPPITAWALDQVARQHPDAVAALLGVGERLRAATTDALGGDASELRSIRADERAAIDAVIRPAVEAVTTTGQQATDAVRQRMTATVRAALGDEELARLLAAGRLVDDYAPSGFGFSSTDLHAKVRPTARPAKAQPKAGSASARSATARLRSVPDPEPEPEPAGPSRKQIDRANRLRDAAAKAASKAKRLEARAVEAEANAMQLRAEADEATEAAEQAEAAALQAEAELA